MQKSNKVMFLVLGFLFTGSRLFAQNFSIYLAGGYGLPRGQDYWNSSMTYNAGHELVSTKDHYLSIGRGISAECGIFIPIFPSVDLRFGGVFHSISPKLVVKRKYQSDNEVDTNTYRADWKGGKVDVVFSHLFNSVCVYAGAGCGLFFASLTRQEVDQISDQTFFKDKAEYRFDPALGLNGFLGVSQSLGAQFSVFAEVFFNQLSFLAREYKILKAEQNGVSVLDEIDLDWDRPGNQTIQTFEKNSVRSNSPEVVQGSSLGIKTGLRIYLGKEKNTSSR